MLVVAAFISANYPGCQQEYNALEQEQKQVDAQMLKICSKPTTVFLLCIIDQIV
jgi:hypothetical protein